MSKSKKDQIYAQIQGKVERFVFDDKLIEGDVTEECELDSGDSLVGYGGGDERVQYRVHDSTGCAARYVVDGEELDALHAELEGGAS